MPNIETLVARLEDAASGGDNVCSSAEAAEWAAELAAARAALLAEFGKMREALEEWQRYMSEGADHPCPDPIMRHEYRQRAEQLTRAALGKAAP